MGISNSGLKLGLQWIKDPKTGEIYHKMPEPYEGQRHWVLYWIDRTGGKSESWKIPVCFRYETLVKQAATMRRKPQTSRQDKEGTLDHVKGVGGIPPNASSD